MGFVKRAKSLGFTRNNTQKCINFLNMHFWCSPILKRREHTKEIKGFIKTLGCEATKSKWWLSRCYRGGLWKKTSLASSSLWCTIDQLFFSWALSSELAKFVMEGSSKGPSTSDSNSLKLYADIQKINVSFILQHDRMQENAVRSTVIRPLWIPLLFYVQE